MCSNHTAVPVHAVSAALPSPACQVSSVAAVVPRSVQYVGLLNSSVIVWLFFLFVFFFVYFIVASSLQSFVRRNPPQTAVEAERAAAPISCRSAAPDWPQ